MLNSINTDKAIIELMKKGAKVCFVIRSEGYDEFPPYVQGCTLLYNGQELRLEKATADRIRKRPDVRQGYAGYRHDYANSWREIYEHKDAPVPRWITEQWDNPVERISRY
jgi:hypothetical protein